MNGCKLLVNNTRFTLNWVAAILVFAAILLGIVPLLLFLAERRHSQIIVFDNNILNVVLFTLKQAFISAFISVVIGMCAARALVQHTFAGRNFVLGLMAVPQSLPAIVAVLGVVSLFGNSGIFAHAFQVYGLAGIVLVHVFFNVPLALRLSLETLNTLSPDSFKLAEQLSFSEFHIFKIIEWPHLRSAGFRMFALIFLLCAASFVVVLTLGGPGATTLEVAIYQSLRMDFDIARAISLSLVQVVLSFVVVLTAGDMMLQKTEGAVGTFIQRRVLASRFGSIFDYALIALVVAGVGLPLFSIAVLGWAQLTISAVLVRAFGFSIAIGSASSFISLCVAWFLAGAETRFSTVAAMASLVFPPAVLATGWFLAFRNFENSLALSLVLVIALNALMALPFSVAVVRAGFMRLSHNHTLLCAQLNVSGWNKFVRVDFPLLKWNMLQAFILGFVLSLGDLTAVTLLGTQGLVTLPALIHQQMSHYRGDDAMGTACFLAVLCFALAFGAQTLRGQHD
jgi:thiamine transport system permease protein